MRTLRKLDDRAAARLERFADETRQAMQASPGGVGAGWSGSLAKGWLQSLRNAVCEVAGPHVAEVAVDDWIISDRPIVDLVLFHRLTPGKRVRPLAGGEAGVVVGPRGEAETVAQRLDGVFASVWVRWVEGEPAVLVRAASLEIVP